MREFIETWLPTFHADSGEVIPVIATDEGKRPLCYGTQVDFVVDGEIEQVPMFVVGDLRTQDTLDEVFIFIAQCYGPSGLQETHVNRRTSKWEIPDY